MACRWVAGDLAVCGCETAVAHCHQNSYPLRLVAAGRTLGLDVQNYVQNPVCVGHILGHFAQNLVDVGKNHIHDGQNPDYVERNPEHVGCNLVLVESTHSVVHTPDQAAGALHTLAMADVDYAGFAHTVLVRSVAEYGAEVDVGNRGVHYQYDARTLEYLVPG